MAQTAVNESALQAFVERWAASGGAERANYQLFLTELCDVFGVPHPEPTQPDHAANAYVFDRSLDVIYPDGSRTSNFIDLYKRGCFVLETKQGVEQREEAALSSVRRAALKKLKKGHGVRGTAVWDTAMIAAKGQAEGYVHALPASEGRPPFVVVVDVGYSIELYSEFTRTGGTYVPFPDPRTHRIFLKDLLDADKRDALVDRLRQVWTDPMALDPSRHTAAVTREIADRLARLAKSLEQAGRDPRSVAEFLMRCLFTMFAEDVGLLPLNGFTRLLEDVRRKPDHFKPAVEDLWRVMNTGGYYSRFMEKLLKFNGGLFATPSALKLSRDQVELLLEAARADWRNVEPAIFGTLLERALDPHERHKLGAHYTPRAYVERLVIPTIVDPLRQEWKAAQAAALALANADKKKQAIKEVRAFHRRLCNVKVLDPACGTGNFLYVTLEHLKRLEGEVFNTLSELGTEEEFAGEGFTVDPHQLLGIEINPRAAAIAELVLWIGYLQWHYRTHGDVAPPEPVIKNFKNIECRDAVLAYDAKRTKVDPDTLKPITHWDGRTTKPHLVTGEEVPDESAQVPEYEYVNPRPAEWPNADFVVGNPPYIGSKRMNQALGDGYVDALRRAHPDLPGSTDFVMAWWKLAAEKCRQNRTRRFGFVTTNSITQYYNSQVIERFLDNGLSLAFAIPDHPWVETSDGASVRISMTVGVSANDAAGRLAEVILEIRDESDTIQVTLKNREGRINASLGIGSDVKDMVPLRANERLCWQGCKLVGQGFRIAEETKTALTDEYPLASPRLRRYWTGSDLIKLRSSSYVVDLYPLAIEEAKKQFPALYQHVQNYVFPERAQNRDRTFREKWWLFGRPRPELRSSLAGIKRYIATSEVAKHRVFTFLSWPEDLIDGSVVAIAIDDAYVFGVLSSSLHVRWSLSSGGRLEDRPRYQNLLCFDPFPFPDPPEPLKARIRELGESLDAHRKRQQALHPGLTMTGMYNVLEKLRSGETKTTSPCAPFKGGPKATSPSAPFEGGPGVRRATPMLTKKEQAIHEQGLVSVLKEIHDELDAAVFEAYGWPADLSDEEILERLVALNAERAAEEARGLVRWLRPEYQAKDQAGAQLEAEGMGPRPVAAAASKKVEKIAWPKSLAEQAQALRSALSGAGGPVTAAEVAKAFKGAKKERVGELLETLAALGQCREVDGERFVA